MTAGTELNITVIKIRVQPMFFPLIIVPSEHDPALRRSLEEKSILKVFWSLVDEGKLAK